MRYFFYILIALWFFNSLNGITLDQAYFQVAQAFEESHNDQQAMEYLQKTIDCNPEHAQALLHLGMQYYHHGKIDKAYSYLQRSCSLNPNNFEAITHAGTSALTLKQIDTAISYYQQATRLNSLSPSAHFLLAHAYTQKNDFIAAINSFSRTLELSPHSVEALLGKANALRESHQLTECLSCYDQLLSLDPDNQKAIFEKAQALTMMGSLDHALVLYEELYKKNTSSQALYYNMAHVYKKMQRYDKAIELYQYILKEAPSFYQAHLALAQAYLYTKNFYQGFKELAFSVKNHLVEKPLLTQLSDAKNKTVLITTSWDAQDMVQLIQFIPLLKQAGAHILLHVDEKLAPLFKTSPFIDQVITTSNTQIPYFDTHISMLALPALCVTAANALPSFTFPFIIPAHLVKQWHKKIHIHGSHSVGLFWNTYTHCDNILESNTIPFSSFTTILENASFNCYALQPVSSQEASIIPCHGRITMLSPDLCPEKDILEFCALLSALDIIITCDSITAHLAGALGKPTLLIVPPIYQWRWIAQEQHSVFYPSAHIIQTNHTNDEQLKAEIVGYLGKYSSIHNCDTIE